MPIRVPAPLRPGDRIGVTAPSSGIGADLRPRLELAVEHVRRHGFDVVVGECMEGGLVSAPAEDRAAELTAMLVDPAIRAVVPPWGGELAVEAVPHVDWAAVGEAEPTWLVGYSDISTLLLPLATVAGIAAVHGPGLMETPYRVPPPLLPWLDVVTAPAGSRVTQGSSTHHRAGGDDNWQDDPTVTEYALDTAGSWRPLAPTAAGVRARGRLLGGCIEAISTLAGTPFGDVPQFARDHADDGLILYLEAAEEAATTIARHLWHLRLAGWFERVDAVLVGRTQAPDSEGLTQLDAVRSALAGIDAPVVVDVDLGHVPPHLSLVNGSLAEVSVEHGSASLTQVLR